MCTSLCQLMPALMSRCKVTCGGAEIEKWLKLVRFLPWMYRPAAKTLMNRQMTKEQTFTTFHGHFMVISWSFHGHESFHALLYLCKNDVLHCTPQKITICKCINYMQLCQDMSSANSTVLEAGALGIAPANTASLPAPTGDSVVRTRDPCISWLKLSLGIQPHLSGTGCNSRAYTRQNRQKKSTWSQHCEVVSLVWCCDFDRFWQQTCPATESPARCRAYV